MKDFCIALYKKRTEDEIYRVYVTDCLQMISENTANQVGGKFIQKRYYDILNPPPVETRTAEAITQEIADNCGIEVTKRLYLKYLLKFNLTLLNPIIQ